MAKKAMKKPSDEASFIEKVVGKMEKQFGKGAALTPNAGTILCKVDHWVTTRNFLIDAAIAGGLPMPRPIIPFARITEISGVNGTGKTTLLGQIIAETQATGGLAAVADTEQALDLAYFQKLGVDLSKLIIVPADTIEDVFTRFEALVAAVKEIDSDRLVCIGWDSLGGTPTNAQAAAEAGDHFYAEAAKVVGKNLQRLMQMISKNRIALIINNHLYRKMGVKYGDPWTSYGGEKLKFYSTLRIRLTRIGQIKEKIQGEDVVIGHKVKVKVVKNKMAPMLRTAEVPCIGDHGFSLDYSIFEHGKKMGVIKTSGAWCDWKGERFQGWNGFQKVIMLHADYPELVEEVVGNYYLRHCG